MGPKNKTAKEKKNVKNIKKVPIKQIVDNSNAKIGIAHYLGIYIWLGWFNLYLMVGLAFAVLWVYPPASKFITIPLTLVIAVLIASAIYPINIKKRPKWGRDLLNWIIGDLAPAYFKLCVFCEDYEAVEKASPAIFTIEPHDILPVSIFTFSEWVGYFPSHDFRGCMTSGVFAVPGMRHIYAWSGARSVEKSIIRNCIETKLSPTVCPGGAQEVTYMSPKEDPHTCILFLKSRLGLIKLAAEYGVPIVPSFSFNQRTIYNYLIPNNALFHWIGRKIGFIPLMFFGWMNIPFGLPKPKRINVVVGAPIEVPKMDAPFTEDKLKPYHDKLLEAYERIFENNKERFDMGHVSLKFE